METIYAFLLGVKLTYLTLLVALVLLVLAMEIAA